MNEIDHVLNSIRTQLEGVPEFGQLQLHIKRHNGGFSNTDVVKISSTKFKSVDPNVDATTMIFRLVKGIADAAETGTLSFTLSFKHGEAQQLTIQDFKKL